jgi:hypothetical protein
MSVGGSCSPKGEKRRRGETDFRWETFGSRILQLTFLICSILDKSCMNPESTFQVSLLHENLLFGSHESMKEE